MIYKFIIPSNYKSIKNFSIEKKIPFEIKRTFILKQCAIMGAYRLGADIKTTVAKAAIIIPCEYIEIKGKAVTMREDMVKVGGISKVADIRYRAQIEDWEADIPVKYVSSVMSLEQVINLFNLGGFACGVGEWRNEKNGIFGAFHVAKS